MKGTPSPQRTAALGEPEAASLPTLKIRSAPPAASLPTLKIRSAPPACSIKAMSIYGPAIGTSNRETHFSAIANGYEKPVDGQAVLEPPAYPAYTVSRNDDVLTGLQAVDGSENGRRRPRSQRPGKGIRRRL